MAKSKEKKPPKIKTIITLLIGLYALSSETFSFLVPVVFLIAAVYIIQKVIRAVSTSANTQTEAEKKPADNADDCPQPICLHSDKGVHHVRRGREIDPWDRPDIDISKYQRR